MQRTLKAGHRLLWLRNGTRALGSGGVLVEAGANPNNRGLDGGATPLYTAACKGNVDTMKLLLRARVNPLWPYSNSSGQIISPLDVAASNVHWGIVRGLIKEHGIERCGVASGGVHALQAAAGYRHIEIMELLIKAAVVDTGVALLTAAACGPDDDCNGSGMVVIHYTPQALAEFSPRCKTMGGTETTEKRLHGLEAARRLLMRVEAVHAVPWLRAEGVASVTHAAAEGGRGGATTTIATPLTSVLPILRRRAGRPRVLLSALHRYSKKH
eukprot:g11679.t1